MIALDCFLFADCQGVGIRKQENLSLIKQDCKTHLCAGALCCILVASHPKASQVSFAFVCFCGKCFEGCECGKRLVKVLCFL